ncbi:MAG: hypothetical protein ACRC7N_00755 [Clostridium sp.]
MNILSVKVVNPPGEEIIEELHKWLAEVILKNLGEEKCRQIIKVYNEEKL